MNNSEIVLITGGTGFAGSHLIEYLTQNTNHKLHATSYNSSPHDFTAAVEIHQLDLTDKAAVQDLLSQVKPTQIYHLASMAVTGNSFENAHQLLQNNLELQLNLLESVKNITPQAKLLVVSSAEVYLPSEKKHTEDDHLQPLNPYGLSKALQDLASQMFFLSHGLKVVRARAFNHTGSRQTDSFVIPAFASQIVAIENGQQETLSVGNLHATRDFSDVRDIVRGYQLIMEQAPAGEVYNIGSGIGVSLDSVLTQLCAMSTVEIKIEADPSRMRPSDVPYKVADISKLNQLGWSPQISLNQTLQDVIKYWRETS